jgi:hypothetical protein
MTKARAEKVYADRLDARTHLAQAENERLDASRSRRNEASYASMLVAQASVDEAREATAELIELARDRLR